MSARQTQAFDFSVNLTKALLWQYNNANNLISIVTQKNQWYLTNQTQFWQNWIRDVFDIRTCNSFGLQVWATILNYPINEPIPGINTGVTFGFGRFNENFNRGNFSGIAEKVNYLSTEQQRLLLRLRYFQLTSKCTVPAINKMLADLLGANGFGYVLDSGKMNIVYIFNLPINSDLGVVLENYDILPRPAAVGVAYRERVKAFGFSAKNKNFNQGNFLT